ncbi:hypothetical protein RchiOBHm_Chr4g0433601 [Rosa chinensis]|uniref:Uncharacterized protein n=1 Tax=Rosa chinensis TaxID=74649 RepID=A0A2P6R1F9_ROSCH|nr:hypothetical protein RchiOBHm_Chr4g0433601 [Rosa chinensis]
MKTVMGALPHERSIFQQVYLVNADVILNKECFPPSYFSYPHRKDERNQKNTLDLIQTTDN